MAFRNVGINGVPYCVVFLAFLSPIAKVLLMFELGYIQEVSFAIVKRISVDVVCYLVGWGVCYDSVHTQKSGFTINLDFCTGIISAPRLLGVPVELHQGKKPFRITKGKHTILQFDKIKRSIGPRFDDFNYHFDERESLPKGWHFGQKP